MLVDQLLHQSASWAPNRPAILSEGLTLSHGQLDRRCSQVANHLAAEGMAPGDRVLMVLPNCPEYPELLFGAARAGLVVIPFNPRASAAEVAALCEHARPGAVVTTDELAEALAGSLPSPLTVLRVGSSYQRVLSASPTRLPGRGSRLGSDPWLIGYTSGSTGQPKGAVLSHLAKATSALVEVVEFGSRGEDVALVNTPLFHVHAIVHVLTLLVAGGAVRIEPGFDPEQTLRLVEAGEVSELSMVPTMYQALLDSSPAGVRLRPPRLARCTGAAMSRRLREEIGERFSDWPVHLFYGATEAGAVSNLRPEQRSARPDSIGLPFLGVELQVRSPEGAILPEGREGEVFIRSAAAFSGYAGSPLDQYGEWLTLGDLGSLDGDGFLTLTGRAGDQIVSGGEKVRPTEVEAVLARLPGVRAAAVFGVPDRRWGEAVWAAVEAGGDDIPSAERLAAACASALAPHKRPKRFIFLDALPLNATGKVDKRSLRELAAEVTREGVNPP